MNKGLEQLQTRISVAQQEDNRERDDEEAGGEGV